MEAGKWYVGRLVGEVQEPIERASDAKLLNPDVDTTNALVAHGTNAGGLRATVFTGVIPEGLWRQWAIDPQTGACPSEGEAKATASDRTGPLVKGIDKREVWSAFERPATTTGRGGGGA